MLRKIHISLSVLILLATAVSPAYAYPQNDVQVGMFYFFQGDSSGKILGCQDNDTACRAMRADRPFSKYGCAVTSMAMLYGSYGFGWIPDEDHHPLHTGTESYLNPATLNNYLAKSADPTLRFSNFGPAATRGFDSNYGIDWLKTTSNFFYADINFLNNILNIRPYRYIVPNYDCAPIDWQVQKKNGKVYTVNRSASCFRMDWTTVGAMTWLDYDIQNYEKSPIMQLQYTKYVNGVKKPNTHFVVIAGYDPTVGGDGGYRAYNPVINDITSLSPEPKALNGKTQYGQENYDFDRLLLSVFLGMSWERRGPMCSRRSSTHRTW